MARFVALALLLPALALAQQAPPATPPPASAPVAPTGVTPTATAPKEEYGSYLVLKGGWFGRLVVGGDFRYMGIAPTFNTIGKITLDRYALLLKAGVRF